MRRPIVADMLTIAFALLCLVIAIFRTATDLRLEIFALRHQLGVLRRQRPGRPHLVRGDRILWVWLYRLWPRCLQALLIVKPATVIRWHRAGFGLYWHWRSKLRRTGRPSVDREIRDLIRQMSRANPLWGAPRIHGELVKLGICIGQTAGANDMIRRLSPLSPNWRTFLRNHMDGIAAVDMFVIATVAFRILYVMVVLGHDRRKIVHFGITQHPTQVWLSRQITEAFPWDTAPRYLLRDRDASYGQGFRERVEAMGVTEVVTAPRSPWQNAYVERVIGSIRRECLDHVVIFNERHLRRILSSYAHYYHRTRTHLSLDKDCPDSRPIQHRSVGRVVAIPRVGGLHHHYERLAA